MKGPIGTELAWGSVDDAVTSVSSGMMSLLTRATLDKPGRLGSIGKELDRLSGLLSAVETENRVLTSISQMSDKVEASNDFASKHLDAASKKASGFMSQRQAQATNRVTKMGFSVLGFVAAMGSKTASAERGEGLTMFLNNIEGWDTVRAALHDLRGATETNIPLLRLINVVKAKVDALRQDFREGVPKTLAKEFSRKLSRAEWSSMHTVMGMSDIMALGLTEARALMRDPSSLSGRVTAAEETVAGLSRPLADRYKAKAKALAIYMVKGDVTSEHLLRNARAIAHLFGEADRPDPTTVGDDLIQAIERLVSLYAYEQLDAESRAAVEALAQSEEKGMEAVTGLLASVRELERQKVLPADQMEADLARNNAIQGFIPALGSGDAQVIVKDDSEQADLRMQGWVRIGTYQGDRKEGVRVSQGYYQSTVAGKAA